MRAPLPTVILRAQTSGMSSRHAESCASFVGHEHDPPAQGAGADCGRTDAQHDRRIAERYGEAVGNLRHAAGREESFDAAQRFGCGLRELRGRTADHRLRDGAPRKKSAPTRP